MAPMSTISPSGIRKAHALRARAWLVTSTLRTATGEGTNAASAEVFVSGDTDDADEPKDVVDLELTAGDSTILAMWKETIDQGSPVTGYQVQIKESDEDDDDYEDVREGSSSTGKPADGDSTQWLIGNLENGMEYTVRVRAYSFAVEGDWSEEEDAMPMAGASTPIPTPALPLFGAFALGAGLLAAGRARLRRREQHQLTR